MSHENEFKSLVWGAVLLVLAACVPLVANGYWMSIALTIAMFTVCLLYTSDAADE